MSGAPTGNLALFVTPENFVVLLGAGGDPRKVQGAYDKANTVADATKIADPLLLIHGMADDNVVFTNSTALAARMQATIAKARGDE